MYQVSIIDDGGGNGIIVTGDLSKLMVRLLGVYQNFFFTCGFLGQAGTAS